MFRWDEKKNIVLKQTRNISFEEVIIVLESDNNIDVVRNPSSNFKQQLMYVVLINDYIWVVPFVEKGNEIFLKTIIPSRKFNKIYNK